MEQLTFSARPNVNFAEKMIHFLVRRRFLWITPDFDLSIIVHFPVLFSHNNTQLNDKFPFAEHGRLLPLTSCLQIP
ncbi:MAG: hypothetical protein LKE62_14340 [Acetobacter sp.]|nr:hypothetical protein [Acetobacter sp.]